MSERTFPASPYKGMEPYSEEDAPFFFGREKERRNIISNLMASRLTLLYGASGVGKSSVLRAGVVHDLRRLARKNTDESGSPEFAVALFNTWLDNPVSRLIASVRESVIKALGESAIGPVDSSRSMVETFRAWAEMVGGNLFVILDQFEDYFLYHGRENGEGSFASEFSRLVNCRDLRVNFLISIRDDTYSKIYFFEEDIPSISENSLGIEQLDREAMRTAIIKPIDQYNRFYGAGRKRIGIEPELVEEVLNGPSIARADTRKKAGATETEEIIETPTLQLVMTTLWKEEMRLGSTTLRLETLKNLGGINKIVETHLTQAMNKLSKKERAMAARVFRHLVTPSGYKMAYTVSDLADQEQLDKKELPVLLEKLAHGDNRILRPFALPERQDEQLYEISLDVLAKPIVEWRTRAEEKAKFARLRRLLIMALVLMSLLTAAGFLYARNERARREAEEARHQEAEARYQAEQAKLRAVKASNVSSQILAQLYKIILGSDNQEEARKNVQKTLSRLNQVLDLYRRDESPAGEGIALNNIAGFHRFMGDSYAAIAYYEEAQGYYKQAQQFYQQAREILKDALGPDHTEVATSLTGQAVIYMSQGNYAEAEQPYKQSLEILENALDPLATDDRYLANALINLAECYKSQGKYAEAEPLYNRALEIRKSKLSENHSDRAQSLYVLAWLYVERGKYAEAEPLFQQALAIWQLDPNEAINVALCLDGLSALYREWGKYAEAEQYLDQALEIYKGIIDKNPLLVAYHVENRAMLYNAQGKAADAEQYYTAALNTWENGLGPDHPDTAYGRSNLASFYSNQGQYNKAEPLFRQALAIQTKAMPDHRRTADTLNAYAELLRKTNRDGEASQMEERARHIQNRQKK